LRVFPFGHSRPAWIRPRFGPSHIQRIRSAIFCKKKWGHLGGTPAVAPEGDLVFGGKPSHPLTLFNNEIYICATNWGMGYAEMRKNLEILSMDRSDVAVRCSKRW
jgi:hypothetical protein